MPDNRKSGINIHTRRVISYVVLALVSLLCLFWFYILFINATKSNSEFGKGFTVIPSKYAIKNFKNLINGTLPVMKGLFNSLTISLCTAFLCVYFSTMTAFAIHAYNFKLKKFMFTMILAIMMIPTQVTALGFLQLIRGMKLEN